MNKGKIDAIDWPSLKQGQRLVNSTWDMVRIVKLDDKKAMYLNGSCDGILVDIELYEGEIGDYYYFKLSSLSWNPLTYRNWKL